MCVGGGDGVCVGMRCVHGLMVCAAWGDGVCMGILCLSACMCVILMSCLVAIWRV